MEKRIERIWCEVIGCQNIGRNDDFYSIGGDSLLIAQAISKMIQNLPEAKKLEMGCFNDGDDEKCNYKRNCRKITK